MSRPLSQLIYARVQEGRGTPRLLTLHQHNGYARDAAHLARMADPDAHIHGLQSYKGVYVGRDIVGYTWFVGPAASPSPLFFGDALAEIERFLWDEAIRQETPDAELPFLIGIEQGAIMALATAAAVPDLISGVIAIDGMLPIVPGWEPPLAPLDELPLLLVTQGGSAPSASATVLTGDALAETFRAWGGVVTTATTADDDTLATTLRTWLAAQTPRVRTLAE